MSAFGSIVTPDLIGQRLTYIAECLKRIEGGLTDRPWNMTVQVYSDNTYIPVAQKCFAVMFTNVGGTTANINGMVIFPSATPTTAIGDSRTISAHKNDIYKGVLNLGFTGVITTPAVEVVQLFYVD